MHSLEANLSPLIQIQHNTRLVAQERLVRLDTSNDMKTGPGLFSKVICKMGICYLDENMRISLEWISVPWLISRGDLMEKLTDHSLATSLAGAVTTLLESLNTVKALFLGISEATDPLEKDIRGILHSSVGEEWEHSFCDNTTRSITDQIWAPLASETEFKNMMRISYHQQRIPILVRVSL